MRVGRRWLCGLAATGVLVAAVPAWGQADTARAERQIKAAFLYKFLGFVEWPPEAFERGDAPLQVGLFGADALADELALVAQRRQVNGRPVQVRKLRAGELPTALHALFVGRAEPASGALIAQARRQPLLLLLGDSEDAIAQGAAISFAVVDDKVRFDVAPLAADQAGLKISSRLMAVARRVVMP